MYNLMKTEFYKLGHMKSFWLITLLSLMVGTLLQLDRGKPDSLCSSICSSLYNIPLLYFLIFIFGALYYGEDFENRTLYSLLCCGHSRSHVLFVKTVVYFLASNVILLGPLCLNALIFILRHGLPKVPVIQPAFYLLPVLLCAMAVLPVLCCAAFRDIGRPLALLLALYFLMIVLLNSGYYRTFAEILPMGQVRLLSLGELNVPPLLILLENLFLIFLGYLVSLGIFLRAEFK